MRWIAALFVALPLACAPALPVTAAAADCGSAASAACAQAGCERILGVRDLGGTCEVTMLVPSGNGQPPRKQTVRVKG
jgi:hypothetical protein